MVLQHGSQGWAQIHPTGDSRITMRSIGMSGAAPIYMCEYRGLGDWGCWCLSLITVFILLPCPQRNVSLSLVPPCQVLCPSSSYQRHSIASPWYSHHANMREPFQVDSLVMRYQGCCSTRSVYVGGGATCV